MLNSYGMNRVFYLDEYLLRYTQNKTENTLNSSTVMSSCSAVYQNDVREIINYNTRARALADHDVD